MKRFICYLLSAVMCFDPFLAFAGDNTIRLLSPQVIVVPDTGYREIRAQIVCIGGYKYVMSWATGSGTTSPTFTPLVKESVSNGNQAPLRCRE